VLAGYLGHGHFALDSHTLSIGLGGGWGGGLSRSRRFHLPNFEDIEPPVSIIMLHTPQNNVANPSTLKTPPVKRPQDLYRGANGSNGDNNESVNKGVARDGRRRARRTEPTNRSPQGRLITVANRTY
jgi:hypothetical protein